MSLVGVINVSIYVLSVHTNVRLGLDSDSIGKSFFENIIKVIKYTEHRTLADGRFDELMARHRR